MQLTFYFIDYHFMRSILHDATCLPTSSIAIYTPDETAIPSLSLPSHLILCNPAVVKSLSSTLTFCPEML